MTITSSAAEQLEVPRLVSAAPHEDFLAYTELHYLFNHSHIPEVNGASMGKIEELPPAWKEELHAVDIARCAQRLRLRLDGSEADRRQYTWHVDSPAQNLSIIRRLHIGETGLTGTWQADKGPGCLTDPINIETRNCYRLAGIVQLAISQLESRSGEQLPLVWPN